MSANYTNQVNNNSIKKYRPSLKASLIDHALSLAKKEQPISNLSIELISILAPFAAKIANGAVLPASVITAKESIEESLGMVDITLYNSNMISKESYWSRCYELYISSPELCTLQEIQAAQEHMYLNDLMTPEELTAFETRQETNFNDSNKGVI